MKHQEVDITEIGTRFKLVRKHLDLMQKDLAKELGVSPATMSEIEAGNSKPSFDILYRLTTMFKLNPFYLITGKGSMFIADDHHLPLSLPDTPIEADFITKFINLFNNSPIFRYAMMSKVREYMLENEALIQRDIESLEKKIL